LSRPAEANRSIQRLNRALLQGVVDATILAAILLDEILTSDTLGCDGSLGKPLLRAFSKTPKRPLQKATRRSVSRELRRHIRITPLPVYVPQNSTALTCALPLTPATARTYLSKRYAVSDKDILLALGVVEMTVDIFLTDLER